MADPNEFWKERRVLVTGACGFVGANLVKALCDQGAFVAGIDLSLSSPSLRALCGSAHPSVIVGDVTDLNTMVNCIGGARPDVVFHLAGQGHIKDAQAAPYAAFDLNAMGTVAVLEAVRRAAPAATVLCASSNHAYIGGSPTIAVTVGRAGFHEASALNAVDVYGASKAMADAAVRCYRESYGLRAVAVRHVNSYGPADPHASHLITMSILSCLAGQPPPLRGRGTALKGYLHISDVVGAYLLVAERADELPGHAVNVSDPASEASVLSVMQLVCEVAGLDPARVRPQPGTTSEQEGYWERLDASLLRSLGWRPQYALREGVAATLSWYRAHGGMAWTR